MARKREFTQQWTFARIDLTTEQRDDCNAFLADPTTNVVELLTMAIEDGYKFSSKYNRDERHWIATLTGTPDAPYNDHTSLSAFHATFEDALGVLLFKHMIIAEQGRWPTQTSRPAWG